VTGDPTYYNTNDENGPDLARSKEMVKGQEAEILAFFRRHALARYTRKEIETFFRLGTPSATRSLCNLTGAGYLQKSDKADTVCRWTGKRVHTWALAQRKPMEQESLW